MNKIDDRSKIMSSIIRSIRKDLGLTMNEFGQLFEPPASDSIVSRWERGVSSPNNERLKKISELGNVPIEYLLSGDPFHKMTKEEQDEFLKNDLKLKIKHMNIKEYKEKTHVQLEEFLNNDEKNFYINNHKLNNEDIKILIALYKGKEHNYPSDDQIQKEYEDIKKNNEEYKKQEASGETFFSTGYRYDINTNEDVEHEIPTNEDTKTDK